MKILYRSCFSPSFQSFIYTVTTGSVATLETISSHLHLITSLARLVLQNSHGPCFSHLIPCYCPPLIVRLHAPAPCFTHIELAALQKHQGLTLPALTHALPSSRDVCQSHSYLRFSFSPPLRSLLGPPFVLPRPPHLTPAGRQLSSIFPWLPRALCSGRYHTKPDV